MDVRVMLIATAAQVEDARAAAVGAAAFLCKLSPTGNLPATHYASSGYIPEEAVAALAGKCTITTGPHDPHAVIAAAGLQIANEPMTA